MQTETTESAETSEAAETGAAGVRMVVLWILLTIALFVLTRRRREKAG